MKSKPQIYDDYCEKILVIMTFYKKSYHFGELLRELKSKNMEMSEPTLSSHLNHLINAGCITRKKDEGTQFVTYSLDPVGFIKAVEIASEIKNKSQLLRDRDITKKFFSLTEEKQIDVCLGFMLSAKLQRIKAQIAYELDPQNVGKRFALLFLKSPILEMDEKWIVSKSIQDGDYRKKILRIIDDYLEELQEEKLGE
jgi:DNA-binding HxlR family transcriptional regulator